MHIKNKWIKLHYSNKVIFIIFLLLLFSYSCESKSKRKFDKQYMSITKFVDGDTFWVDDGSKKGLKIRLIGVNTPETIDPRKPVEFYGKEASNYVKHLLADKKVRLEYDIDKIDRYGRTLAYVFLKDGTSLNADLIEKGYGRVMTVPPNVKYSEKFIELERKARENNIGLWKK